MKNRNVAAFTGGGTGGHIYPGLAVADSLRGHFAGNGEAVRIVWLGSRGKMDRDIVRSARFGGTEGDSEAPREVGQCLIDAFYGIPSGKLRRYFSLRNFLDIFKIGFGLLASLFVLLKERPAFLFSKGGFASVPPCVAARILGIRVYTHECDFTPGLATRINSRFADKIFLSYDETRRYFPSAMQKRLVVTGNPVRGAFYAAKPEIGRDFVFKGSRRPSEDARPQKDGAAEGGAPKEEKPVLLITGGSLGAAQINSLVAENLEWLCEHFVVVHQTGQKNASSDSGGAVKDYHPFPFIYEEMPHVFALSDVVLSRSGANSIWEAAVLAKPMVLLPLEGEGTRGDQVDNAEFFSRQGAAIVIRKAEASSQRLREALSRLLRKEVREEFSRACRKVVGDERPCERIAGILFEENFGGGIL